MKFEQVQEESSFQSKILNSDNQVWLTGVKFNKHEVPAGVTLDEATGEVMMDRKEDEKYEEIALHILGSGRYNTDFDKYSEVELFHIRNKFESLRHASKTCENVVEYVMARRHYVDELENAQSFDEIIAILRTYQVTYKEEFISEIEKKGRSINLEEISELELRDALKRVFEI